MTFLIVVKRKASPVIVIVRLTIAKIASLCCVSQCLCDLRSVCNLLVRDDLSDIDIWFSMSIIQIQVTEKYSSAMCYLNACVTYDECVTYGPLVNSEGGPSPI